MIGRYKSTAKLGRYVACNTAEGCPGISTDHAGQNVRAIPAAKLEAHAILWGLKLLADPDRLAAWVAAYDRQQMGADDDAKALERKKELEGRGAEMVKALGQGLVTADQLQDFQRETEQELAETEAAIERLAAASARSTSLRLSINALKTSGPLLAYLMSAEVKVPLPDEGTMSDPDAWKMMRGWLEGEARDVLGGISAMGVGRPKAGAPEARDLHPAATEWARALITWLDLTWVVAGPDPSDWHFEGQAPTKGSGPGTMPGWQPSMNRQIGSQERMAPQGLSSIRSSPIALPGRPG